MPYITSNGYVRIKTRGKWRDWLEHRKVMKEAMEEWSYYGPDIPDGFEVHHIDYNRQNNVLSNLLLLDERIHNALQSDNMQKFMKNEWQKRKGPVSEDMPDWVTNEYFG